MKLQRRIKATAAVLVLLGIILLIWRAHCEDVPIASPTAAASQPISQAIRHPIDYAKNHFTGGIGALLKTDPASGLVAIAEVLNGSPASDAGLRGGDVIQVNGVPTKGKSMNQVVDDLRGLASREVTFTIQRAGTTNQEITLHRSSWSSLGISPYSPSTSSPVPRTSASVRPVPTFVITASNSPAQAP